MGALSLKDLDTEDKRRRFTMKKTIFGITVLVLLIAFLGFLSAANNVVDHGTIKVYGYIEGGLYFNVVSLSIPSINLLSDQMSPTGGGVDIGSWTLRVDNPPANHSNLRVRYEYDPLTSTNERVEDEIEFVLLEKELQSGEVFTERESGSLLMVASGGEESITVLEKNLLVRLTSNGLTQATQAAATDTYQSSITISLLAD